MTTDAERQGGGGEPAVAEPGMTFYQRPNRSRCTIAGPQGIVIESPTKAPNKFWRVMQRWCLGIVWEVLDDEQ